VSVRLTLPADANQVDETGYVWAFLSDAAEPERIRPGAVIVAADTDEPFMARVIGVGERIVHLDVLGTPDQLIAELRHGSLLPD